MKRFTVEVLLFLAIALFAAPTFASDVTLHWDAPINSPVQVTGYDLRVSQVQGNYTNSLSFTVNSPTTLNVVATNLTAGQTYYATVYAIGVGNTRSTGSNEVSFVAPFPVGYPAITTQPQNRSVIAGQTATFTVVATGTAPLSYQWRKNGTSISGATSASYTTPAVVAGDNGAKFSVVVSNSVGSVTSSDATLTVSASYALTVTKSGTGSGTVTGSGINCGSTCSVTLASGTAVTLMASAANGSTFSGWSGACTGTGTCAITMSAARAVTATFTATTVPVAPTISTQPQAATVTVGQTATFIVGATGTAPLSYQWKKNGANISGATAASYTTPATVIGDNNALFTVTVTNSVSSVTSSPPAKLTVNAPVTYSLNVTKSGSGTGTVTGSGINCGSTCSATLTSGAVATLSVSATNGSTFAGWGGSCSGTGSCSVTMNGNRTVSAAFTAAGAPTITSQPQSRTVAIGQRATFSVIVTGTAPLSYQWKKNGANIAGATAASYTTPAVTSADNAAMFTVAITNSISSVTSAQATLTVLSATPTPTPTLTPSPTVTPTPGAPSVPKNFRRLS